MSFMRERVERTLERVGETLVIEGSNRTAIVSPMSVAQARNFVDPLVVDSLSRPI